MSLNSNKASIRTNLYVEIGAFLIFIIILAFKEIAGKQALSLKG